jgi:hypothetical protein
VFYYYHCGETYDGGVLVPEGIIRPCFITHCGDTYDAGVLVLEGIIHPCFITITVKILIMAEYLSPRVLSPLFYYYHAGTDTPTS